MTDHTDQIKAYRGNPNLKRINSKVNWTPIRIAEYARCLEDPIYFIEKHMKIINVDRGLISFKLYDYQKEMIRTMHENRHTIIGTARQAGKALPLDTPIPSPNGWTTMGELNVGDIIFDNNGKPTKVTAISQIFENHDCYKIIFDDKTSIVADSDHLWEVTDKEQREIVISTSHLYEDYLFKKKNKRGYVESLYKIKNTEPVEYEEKEVYIDPYTLGLWLGDGTSRTAGFTSHIDDLIFYKTEIPFEFGKKHKRNEELNQKIYTGTIHGLHKWLEEYNLLQNKHIPVEYLHNSKEVRIALLQGLMDTDGWVDKNGYQSIQLTLKNTQLLDNLYELLVSLGIKVRVYDKKSTNSRRFSFAVPSDDFYTFRLPRKKDKQSKILKQHNYIKHRYITDVQIVDSVQTKCIVVDNKKHLFLCGKQMVPTHNSVTTCGYILWYILFNQEKTVALLANKGDTAREILSKVTLAYQHLPRWLQMGIREINKGSITLENGSRVIASATSSDNIRGFAVNFLYIDEAAFVEHWDNFFTSVFPTISSGHTTKICLVSTPNGLNHFYKLFKEAEEQRNDYKPVRVIWNRVPGRDEEWKRSTLAGMGGDIQKFAQEHEMEFQGSSGTLIAGWKLKELSHSKPISRNDALVVYENPKPDRAYLIVADTSHGKSLDYSAFQVIDVSEMPYKQVAVFHSNTTAPYDFAEIINRTARNYSMASVLCENNDLGTQVVDVLHYDFEYEGILYTENAGTAGKRISGGSKGSSERGVKTTKTVKTVGCSLLKLLVEQNQLIVNDFNTIGELSTFSKKGSSYEAEEGNHDDLVMCLVLFAWIADQQYFKDLTDINTLYKLREKDDEEMDTYMLPFGFIDDGRGIHQDEVIDLTKNPGDWWMFRDF